MKAVIDYFWYSGQRKFRVLLLLSCLYFLWSRVEHWNLANSIQSGYQILVLDDQIYVKGQTKSFKNADKLHETQIRLAVDALLVRGPNGLNYQERFEQLYAGAALDKAQAIIDEDAASFSENKIDQVVRVSDLNLIRVDDASVRATVLGLLVRTGELSGQPVRIVLQFKLSLIMVNNPRMLENGLYPTIVKNFELEIKPLSEK